MAAVATKLVVFVLVATGVALLVRRFGTQIGEAAGRAFENAPDDFPPKWMITNITAIRDQTEAIRIQSDRILSLIDEDEQ